MLGVCQHYSLFARSSYPEAGQTPSTGLRHPFSRRRVPESDARSLSTLLTLRSLFVSWSWPDSKHWFTTSFLQEEGAGKRCSEFVNTTHSSLALRILKLAAGCKLSKHWFTTSTLQQEVPESDAGSVSTLCWLYPKARCLPDSRTGLWHPFSRSVACAAFRCFFVFCFVFFLSIRDSSFLHSMHAPKRHHYYR